MTTTTTKAVTDIKMGDKFAHEGRVQWEAMADARAHDDGTVTLSVIHEPDGGTGWREWTDATITLEIMEAQA